jgi:hypothetical protein
MFYQYGLWLVVSQICATMQDKCLQQNNKTDSTNYAQHIIFKKRFAKASECSS